MSDEIEISDVEPSEEPVEEYVGPEDLPLEAPLDVVVEHYVGTADPHDNTCMPQARIQVEGRHVGYMDIMRPDARFCWLPPQNMPVSLTIEEKMFVVNAARKQVAEIRSRLEKEFRKFKAISEGWFIADDWTD